MVLSIYQKRLCLVVSRCACLHLVSKSKRDTCTHLWGTSPSFSQTKPCHWPLPWYRPFACVTHHIWLASLSSFLLNSYLLLTDLSKCPSLRQLQIFYHTHWTFHLDGDSHLSKSANSLENSNSLGDNLWIELPSRGTYSIPPYPHPTPTVPFFCILMNCNP